MAIPYERGVAEDLNLGFGTTSVSMPGGGSATGNKIGLHTLTKWFNYEDFVAAAGNDHTQGFLDVISASLNEKGRPIVIPPRQTPFVIEQKISWSTAELNAPLLVLIGSGRAMSRFDSRVPNNPMLEITGGGASQHIRGIHLSDFSIITTAAPAGGRGVDLRGVIGGRFERVWIEGLASDAIRTQNTNGNDTDSVTHLIFEMLTCLLNGGWGLNMPNTVNSASGDYTLNSCIFDRNTAGGMRFAGLGLRAANSFFGTSGAVGLTGTGLQIPQMTSSTSNQVNLENCEFQNCADFLIDAQAVTGMEVRDAKLIFDGVPTIGIRIGNGGANTASNVHIVRPQIRKDSGTITVVQFGSNSAFGRLEDPIANTSAGVTHYTDTAGGIQNRVRIESSERYPWKPSVQPAGLTSGGSYTPDVSQASMWRIIVGGGGGGSFAINNPINTNGPLTLGVSDGFELDLVLYNNTAGSLTFTFGVAFNVVTPPSLPTPGNKITARFRLLGSAGAWTQVGAWAGPFAG